MNFKYLIVEHEGLPVPVIFGTSLRHDTVANLLGRPVLGAGHVKLWPDGHEPHIELCGRAGTLGIDPVNEDAEHIAADYQRLRGKALSSVTEQAVQS